MGADVIFVAGDTVLVRCRPDEIRRAARNLIENAVRHAGSARVGVVRREDMVEVHVDDDGPGLADAWIAEAFEPFRRAARDGVAGHGLGLTLARTIARAHGGDVQLSNRAGGGLRAVLSVTAHA